ncbi:unnamed protein product [Leptidea sinapis]|uniref:Uncharacterized protein n=1 Tax=Leptidea sinapis TaxID=189913 RepID=A0A5E4QWU4_9NEOP|nr:unnamed protein product [Leptidea sinapis]
MDFKQVIFLLVAVSLLNVTNSLDLYRVTLILTKVTDGNSDECSSGANTSANSVAASDGSAVANVGQVVNEIEVPEDS